MLKYFLFPPPDMIAVIVVIVILECLMLMAIKVFDSIDCYNGVYIIDCYIRVFSAYGLFTVTLDGCRNEVYIIDCYIRVFSDGYNMLTAALNDCHNGVMIVINKNMMISMIL